MPMREKSRYTAYPNTPRILAGGSHDKFACVAEITFTSRLTGAAGAAGGGEVGVETVAETDAGAGVVAVGKDSATALAGVLERARGTGLIPVVVSSVAETWFGDW